MPAVQYGSLPFDEQIRFFREKLNMPTQAWTDLWEGMHARAFVVAGAMQEDLLTDLRAAVDRAVAEGATLAQFRKDFDALVERRGWQYRGGRNWRTRVIFETNLRQSYNAGRELQMKDPALRKRRPFGLYRHGRSEHPRPEHLEWDGTVLPLDHPWWETHTPQNGWGCKCRKQMVSAADVARLGLKVSGQAPPILWREVTVGQRGPNPRTVRVPAGIDPGFAYNPGTAAWGRQLSQEVMDGWRAAGAAAWERLTPGDWESWGRPKMLPVDIPKAKVGPVIAEKERAVVALKAVLGGPETTYATPAGHPVLVNAESLVEHIQGDLAARSPYLTLIPETIRDPYEVWCTFERHKGTGVVVLRQRLIKVIKTQKDRGMIVVAQSRKGMLEAWTVFARSKVASLKNERRGILLWGRK